MSFILTELGMPLFPNSDIIAVILSWILIDTRLEPGQQMLQGSRLHRKGSRLHWRKNTFLYSAANEWNQMPSNIKEIATANHLKRAVKEYLLS